jgi:hypothetical protein
MCSGMTLSGSIPPFSTKASHANTGCKQLSCENNQNVNMVEFPQETIATPAPARLIIEYAKWCDRTRVSPRSISVTLARDSCKVEAIVRLYHWPLLFLYFLTPFLFLLLNVGS